MKVAIKKEQAQAVAQESYNNFYSMLDAAIEGKQPLKPLARKPIKKATESLDANSSQSEFIDAIGVAVGSFIRDNRNAFNIDDNEALREFIEVLSVQDVVDRIMVELTVEEEPQEKDASDLESTDDSEEVEDSSNDQDSDLVSEDVMKLLED